MSNIVTKLNLNKTPNLVEPYSMVFAKNVRVDIDGSLHKDYGIKPFLGFDSEGRAYDQRTIIYKILNDFDNIINETTSDNEKLIVTEYRDKVKNILVQINNSNPSILHIIDVIPYNDEFYCFFNAIVEYKTTNPETQVEETNTKEDSFIFCYKEKEDRFYPCNTAWKYHNGKIDGCVLNNIVGEKILVIAEYDTNEKVPLKCINLTKSKNTDDESVYTQSPIIPITNLNCNGTFNYVIPNGCYQFFVRYKIRDNFYTDWFPASKELFTGNNNTTVTNFGTIKYVNTHTDSNESFILSVEHLITKNTQYYKSFQVGFICSHDDTVVARAWKHFDINTNIIHFDYKTEDGTEIEITDLTKFTYSIYNVENITSFKNKVYISNYEESNFNEDFNNIAKNVEITLEQVSKNDGYGDYTVEPTVINNKKYITKIDNIPIKYQDETNNSIVKSLIDNIKNIILDSNNLIQTTSDHYDSTEEKTTVYDCDIKLDRSNLKNQQLEIKNNIETKVVNYVRNTLKFKSEPYEYHIDNKIVNNIEEALTVIYNKITAINENGIFVDNNYNNKNQFTIEIYREYTYDCIIKKPQPLIPDNGIIDNPKSKITNIPTIEQQIDTVKVGYIQKITITFIAYKNKINTNNIDNLIRYTTLIPYQHYKFYIHFVKDNGEVTNGYYCSGIHAGEIVPDYKSTCNNIIYPVFSNITIPKGYVCCFFSIFHNAVDVATIYNINKILDGTNKPKYYEGNCLDLNLRLIPGYRNINIKFKSLDINSDGTSKLTEKSVLGNYYYSSDSSYSRYFGAEGIINIKANGINFNDNNEDVMYLTTDYEFNQENNINLIKCTPYIKTESYNNYNDLNLNGYICRIYPVERNRSLNYYTDGNSVWKKQNIDDLDNNQTSVNITLNELGKYTDSTNQISDFTLVTTNPVTIYSNYNLNYLSLSNDPIQVNKTYYTVKSTDTVTDATTKTVIWRLFTSLTLSEMYKLESMYKSYTRKIYSAYNKNDIVRFDNTIRSSELEEDESRINVFKFNPDDYYNVPTNRGIITNLKGIGDNIIVHTKDSMFKFTGSNNLQSTTGEIQPSETDVFQTGISEVFGSDFGYAGLQDKRNSIITETGYIFYDKDSNVIYMYAGQGQITKLSDSIERLFNHAPISDVRFANDYYNNRIFVCIWFKYENTTKPVTLSFYLNQNNRAFISLHDFYFIKAFNTKVNCYFINKRETNICKIDKSNFSRYMGLTIENEDDIYPRSIKFTKEPFRVYRDIEDDEIELDVADVDSIVDIIYNFDYETIKTLNNISWCSKLIKEVFALPKNMIYENMAESIDYDIPAMSITVYTDTTCSETIQIDKKSNDYSIYSANSFKLPRYNQGYWSLNYFRNILNANNKFKYLNNYDDGRQNSALRSDENSLIEGKYFVVRFVFKANKDFKLESINFNYSNKQ